MKPIHILCAIAVALLWGGNFVAAKYGVAYFPPFFFTLLRFICVSLLLVPRVTRPSKAQLRQIAPISCLATFHFSLLFVALSRGLDIASSSIAGQLGVPFACVLGAIFLGDRIGVWRILGICVAFAGIVVVTGAPNIAAHQTAFLLALGSAFSWGAANIFVKRVEDIESMQLLAWMSLFTIPFLIMLSLYFEGNPWPTIAHAPLSSLLALAYTTIASTIIAYGLWYFLLGKYTVSQVAPFSLLTPIFGIGLGQVFFSETLTTEIITGGAITILGVAVIVMRRPRLAFFARPS